MGYMKDARQVPGFLAFTNNGLNYGTKGGGFSVKQNYVTFWSILVYLHCGKSPQLVKFTLQSIVWVQPLLNNVDSVR